MTDAETTIAQLRAAVQAFQQERDWRQFHAPKNLAMGLGIEAAELMEHFLWLTPEQSERTTDDPDTRRAVAAEMADCLAYLLNLANVMEIDLAAAFEMKMAANARKYPAEQYRGKFQL